MITKTFNLLKKNPMLIYLQLAYLIISLFITFFLYPWNWLQNMNTVAVTFNFTSYLLIMIRSMLTFIFMFILSLLYLSGYGNLIRNAILNDASSIHDILSGIKHFFVRVLLTSLLLSAIIFGVYFVMLIFIIPLSLFLISNPYMLVIVITSVVMLVLIFSLPFVLLWYPSIFLDDIGVIQGFSASIRAGVKSYWKLILILFVYSVPIILNFIISFNSSSKGVIFTPAYFILLIITSIISFVMLSMLFIVYREYQIKQSN